MTIVLDEEKTLSLEDWTEIGMTDDGPPVPPAAFIGPSGVRFDLIDDEIAWAESEKAKGVMSAWNQDEWAINYAPCGTAFCIAGHVAARVGHIDWGTNGNARSVIAVTMPNGEDREIWSVATETLGLTAYQEWYPEEDGDMEGFNPGDLFSGSNSIRDLKRIRDQYAELEGVPTKYNYGREGAND